MNGNNNKYKEKYEQSRCMTERTIGFGFITGFMLFLLVLFINFN